MTKKLKDRLLAMQGFRRRPPRPPKNLNWQPNEARIATVRVDETGLKTRRAWSDWLAQFEEVIRQRGAAALPFPVDGEFRTSLRNLVLNVAAMEGFGVHLRAAGHFALGPDLVGALVALRFEISRAYDAARNGDGDVPAELTERLRLIAFAKRAQKDLKTVLAAVKIGWPHPSAICESAARED
jgi:hypothetical protein